MVKSYILKPAHLYFLIEPLRIYLFGLPANEVADKRVSLVFQNPQRIQQNYYSFTFDKVTEK